jgi:hypothetical protein
MSLEERLAENTAALKELTAALLAAGALQTAQAMTSPAVQAVTRAQKAADTKKAEDAAKKPQTQDTPPAADAPVASGEQSAPTGESSSSEPTELQPWAEKTAKLYGDLKDGEPTLDNLRKAVLGINGMIGREQAEAVLQRFGAQAITPKDNKKGLDAAQYPDAFAMCLDVLSGRVDATASMVSE